MNKKIVTLILVILISFCFVSNVVADSVSHDNNNTQDHVKTIDNDKKVDKEKNVDKDKKVDKNKKTDKNKTTTNKNKTTDKSKKNYILALGSGNDIMFSDGFRGFVIDHSKPPAKSGDEFQRVSTSHAGNSNKLKLDIIESYIDDSADQIESKVNKSSNVKAGEAFAASHQTVGDHEVVKINNHTEAIFDFEVLKSVSGNVSDYFAYKVSFRTINVEKNINQTNNLTNVTNTTNVTNKTNVTNITQPVNNQTNASFLKGLYDYLAALANALYGAWKPIVNTLINDFVMIINALEGLAKLFEQVMMEIQSFMDALGKLLKLLQELWKELDGLLKLLAILLDAIQQLLDLIQAIIDFIINLINAIIAFIMELLEWLFALIQFLIDLIYQIIALIKAILAFLASVGSFLINVIESAVIIITTFVIITIGAFVYNRIR